MGFNTKLIFALSIFTHNCCNSYKEYNLQSDNVCNKELNVGHGNRSSILVKHAGEIKELNDKKDFECVFFAKANFELGLFAVIQKMNLRRDKDTNHCIDFIKFRHGKKKSLSNWMTNWKSDKKESAWSSPICGKVERLEEPLTTGIEAASMSKETDLVPHAFQDPDGDIEVKIHISRNKVADFSFRDLLLVIAFTSYRECKTDMGGYKSCGHNTCIYKDYFDDKIVNCPYVDCLDESQCPDFVLGDNDSGGFLSTKVTITAVSSIFLSFFLFLGCIMLCRYMEIMCWSGSPTQDRGTELSQVEPSAPPLPSPDKDLPPAYETLFPDG